MANTVIWLVQQVIPPLLLTYFYFAWKITTLELGPWLISNNSLHPIYGYIYTALPTLFILPITLFYTRLYFLPSTQSVPPYDPPLAIKNKQIIFQCLSPSEAKAIRIAKDEPHDDHQPMIERCYKGKCGGRWKPARTRHCSMCGRCRGGWDHHCPLFANCLTAPYMRTFLALLLYTLPAVFVISLPLYPKLYIRAKDAYMYSWFDQNIRENWWNWGYSWVIAGGPIGRFVGGVFLGWRELDKIEGSGGGILRLNVGLMVGFGIILALISAGLAFTTLSLLVKGDLTIDKGRSNAHNQALSAIHRLKVQNQDIAIPLELEVKLSRFSDKPHFFVPLPLSASTSTSHPSPRSKGVVVETLDHEKPYDHGWKKNLEIVLGHLGWGWLLPWNALRRGMGDEVFLWPIEDGVERRLREEAKRRSQAAPHILSSGDMSRTVNVIEGI